VSVTGLVALVEAEALCPGMVTAAMTENTASKPSAQQKLAIVRSRNF
jgi:hypothetical protein